MKVSFGKKAAVAVGAGAIAVAASGVAYAYITGGSGSGGGSATPASSLTVNDLSTTVASTGVSGLVPGGSAVATTVVVHNPHTYSIHFSSISVALDTSGSWAAACQISSANATAWFTPGSATSPAGGYTAKPGDTTFTGPTVAMNDDQTHDQTGCSSVPLTFSFS